MFDSLDSIAPPPLDAKPVILVDWLELVAFFSDQRRARLDEIDNIFCIQDDDNADEYIQADDAAADAGREALRELVENEIIDRSDQLDAAYPFELSDDGEELLLKPRGARAGCAFYLACLIISHFTGSPILTRPPTGQQAATVRKRQFQTMATLAVAGHASGPALSFGWPRLNGEGIVDAVERCCALSQAGTARNPPGPEASARAKDGGMDVIAWKPGINQRPPPAIMYFGQAASGRHWKDKSTLHELESFLAGYFLDRPNCNVAGVTVVPHRLSVEDHQHLGRRHGHILDRTRAPRAALEGLRLAIVDGHHVDEVSSVPKLYLWLARYRKSLSEAA